jgi:ABC-type Fe3+-hydroxamate transport system substrate-binding protein
MDAFFLKEVEIIATTKPDIVFLERGNEQSSSIYKAIKKIIAQYAIKVINYFDNGVNTYKG